MVEVAGDLALKNTQERGSEWIIHTSPHSAVILCTGAAQSTEFSSCPA
ncbi:hypothetical protein CZ674_13300 [Agrococcus casei LMG 22410]|uniref:Uncharacterized protein n=1 Tax=Agrococcus casei LMG 22410 TaxID=1255656 RepID=A0A1R4GMY0_9MICO|nr:hypothetical protein CZ674_13300 [Agrococcus casei LMG 22410]